MKGESNVVGFDQFLKLFGDMTVSTIAVIALAFFFCYKGYKYFIKFLDNKKDLAIKKHEAEKEKDEKLNKVFEEVNRYPEYREQSRKIQQTFREEIDGLKESQQELAKAQQDICGTLKDMQEKQERRDRNKLRDRLLQSYRYYTDIEKNPSQTWTRMESEAFWELFRDYEDAGGNGYMHSTVQPAMNLLKVIDN